MNRNIEEENQMFTIIESSFLSPILIDEYCTLSANEIVCFENQLNSSLVPVGYLTQPLPDAHSIFTAPTYFSRSVLWNNLVKSSLLG
jgi:hypothetical protein